MTLSVHGGLAWPPCPSSSTASESPLTPYPVLMSLLFPAPGPDFVALRDKRPGPGARLLRPLIHQSQPCPGASCSSTPTPPRFVLETTRPGAQPSSSLSRKHLALWQMPLSRACCSPESCPQGGPTGLLGAVGTPCPVVIQRESGASPILNETLSSHPTCSAGPASCPHPFSVYLCPFHFSFVLIC